MEQPVEAPASPAPRKKGSKLWSVIKIAGATLIIVVFAAFTAAMMAANSKAGRVPVGHQLARLQLWSQLPKQIDENTVLTGVRVEGHTLVFEYEVESPKLSAGLATSVKNTACGENGVRSAMDIGARYQFEYYAKSGEFLSSVLVTSRDCLI